MMKPVTLGAMISYPDRSAILKLSVPMIIAMSVRTVYNLADAIRVSGIDGVAIYSEE